MPTAVAAILLGGLARLAGDKFGRLANACIGMGFRAVTGSQPRYRFTLTGVENLPKGGAVLCPNHQSLMDVVYLYSLPVAYRWVIKKEVFALPLFGVAMRLARYPEIDRGNPDSALGLVDAANELLTAGVSILSFPEGTRAISDRLGRFHKGPARIATLNQVPLVPVGVVGTAWLLRPGSLAFPSRGHVSIHIGPPLETRGRSVGEVRALTRELRSRVEAAKATAQRAIDEASTVR